MYVIRSMSTTDACRDQPITPYHIYLLKPEKRIGAYWARHQIDAAKFDTVEAALEEGARCLRGDTSFDVVPQNDSQVPTYWDARKGNYRNRVIGTEVSDAV